MRQWLATWRRAFIFPSDGPAQLEFDITVPRNSRLVFAVGRAHPKPVSSGSVTFEVSARRTSSFVFFRRDFSETTEAQPGWKEVSLDLRQVEGQKVRLRFQTLASRRSVAVAVGEPRITLANQSALSVRERSCVPDPDLFLTLTESVKKHATHDSRTLRAGPRVRIDWLERAVFLGLVGLGLTLLYFGWRLFWFMTDDAYIAFRYVENSLRGYGHVWNPPPFMPVEGYTSFLWVLLLGWISALQSPVSPVSFFL